MKILAWHGITNTVINKKEVIMRLKEYIGLSGKTLSVSAKEMEMPYVTLKRYCDGTRIPNLRNMDKIRRRSKGQVTANDFYDMGERWLTVYFVGLDFINGDVYVVIPSVVQKEVASDAEN